MSEAVDKQAFPSLFPLIPFPLVLSKTPETVSTIEAKKNEKERQSAKAVEEDPLPGQGISISFFLIKGPRLIQ
jgi:hypothetical protein